MQRFSTTLLTLAVVLVPVCAQQPAQTTPQSAQQQLFGQRNAPQPQPTPPLPPPRVRVEDYRERAARIIGAALTDDTAYRRLAWLTDRIGNRLSGSDSLQRAIEWAASEMKRDGLDGVHTEKVMVPHWVRGEESLELVSPVSRRLSMLGLGDSVGTPAGGVTAEAVVVHSFDELEALGEKLRGKIVVYNVPFTNYGATVEYRALGPSRAARYGALAAIVRSVTPVSLQTPHTGGLRYDDAQPRIPAAAATIEAVEMIERMQSRGEHPQLRLTMGAHFLPDAESANVVAEIKGREKPEEVVVIGGHIDSWDVGQGAQDDGGGIIATWEAVRLLKKLGLRPRRTIRVVLFTNEENGARGGAGYAEAHRSELAHHVLAIESDSGVFRPTGFGLSEKATPQSRADFTEIAKLLAGLRADHINPDGEGTDISPMMQAGVTGASLDVDGTHYFDIHHTQADTFDKVNPQELAACVAALAVMAYVVADMPERL
ncbi:MAG TPA: M20/M25/M40 family metallo-hydrolase [Pyrinomonadaceae bacterium]|nr:M20/M25/M40 family metallo-hydrolase [Pyrinomonadaceae bacterium]